MTYIPRAAQGTIKRMSKMYGAVLVTGARQVGKTTLLEHVVQPSETLTMDDANTIEAANADPQGFLSLHDPPLLLDEVQKATALFPAMKLAIDRRKGSAQGKGLFFMSGSEQFDLMQNVSESMSGRVGILVLMGLSLRESLAGKASGSGNDAVSSVANSKPDINPQPLVPGLEQLKSRGNGAASIDIKGLWERIQRGSMPELVANPDYDWSSYYGSYLQTYIERDVRRLTQVDNELQFQSFMRVVAARTGQMLNISDVAHDVGINDAKAKKWLSILIASHLVYLLRPYYTNLGQRALKTPKLYLTDTGLAAYLTHWSSPDVMREGAMSGAFFETFVIGEMLKSYYNNGELDPPLYYYRDKDKREIDLLIAKDGQLHPLEIKKKSNPDTGDISAFKVLDSIAGVSRGSGGVICPADKAMPLGPQDFIIPVGYV